MNNQLTYTAWIVGLFVQIYNVFIVIGALVANNYLILPELSSLPSVIWWMAFLNCSLTALVGATMFYHYRNNAFDEIKKLVPVSPIVVTMVIINVCLMLANGFSGFAVFTTLVYLGLFYVRFNKIAD
ncbi:hypothetical protein D3C87_650970 [compost metagenome]